MMETVEKNYENTTAVLNNVILFKFERSTTFKIIIVFAVVQLFGLLATASNVYNTFCQDLFDPNKSWKTRIYEHVFSLFTIFAACLFGPVIFITTFVIANRTIRRIILHKGGQKVTFVTYNPIPNRNIFTVPLENVSCKTSRTFRSTVPLSIKNRRFYYFVDTDGEFLNSNLFDFTVGVKRDFN